MDLKSGEFWTVAILRYHGPDEADVVNFMNFFRNLKL